MTPVLDEKSGLGDAGWEGQNQIQVGAVSEGMPAASAGLQKGDLLVKVNGIPIHSRFTLARDDSQERWQAGDHRICSR